MRPARIFTDIALCLGPDVSRMAAPAACGNLDRGIHMVSLRQSLLLGTVGILAAGNAALAQTTAPVEEVVVTGTLITGNGYQAPTPVTAVTANDLLRVTPESIPAGLEQLPQFTMSASTNNYGTQAGTPGAGNYLNLRGLGAIESLTLMDGNRLPATSFNGTVDANIIPQAFASRVDVVTGGASATYGSDAVSGVVNFIINKKFDGLKGSAQGGVSDFGDDAQLKFSIAGGTSLFSDKGHVEASYEHFQQPGVTCIRKVAGDCDRPNAFGYGLVGAGTAANPYKLGTNLTVNNSTYGTLITSAANSAGKTVPFTFNNFQFGPGGTVMPFSAGTPTGTATENSGGQGAVTFGTSLTGSLSSDQGYGRFDYDITDDISAYASLALSQTKNSYITVTDGSQVNAYHIFQDNAFLPTSVAQAMAAQGVAYFVGSRYEADQTPKLASTINTAWIAQGGISGKLWNWNWSANMTYGDSQLRTTQAGNFQQDRWYAALDAVRDSNGSIVCRVTLTNPGLYPGCLPWNGFGDGSPSQASYNYIEGTEAFKVDNQMTDLTARVSGALFDLPAGTVSMAAGFEYRYEDLNETAASDPSVPIDQTGLCHQVNAAGAPTGNPVTSAQCTAITLASGIVSSTTVPGVLKFSTTNVGPSHGNESIEEGFVEFAVPLLKDMPFIEELDANVAGRFAQYSISGSAETWKLGVNYQPIDEVRIRATMSRDFRAPFLYDLFAGSSATFGNFNDAVHSGTQQYINTYSLGNPNLKPEIGNTSTVGVVWSPTYIDGFTASLDYYTIRITDQIAKISSTTEDQLCEASGGTDPLCANIVRATPFSDHTAASFPLRIYTIPFNQASVSQTGFDFDMSYRLGLDAIFADATSSMNFRFIGTYIPSILTYTGIGGRIVQSAGAGSTPKIKFNVTANYLDGPINVGARVRFIGEDHFTHDPTLFYAFNNGVASPDRAYIDLNASYDFKLAGVDMQAYLGIDNLTNMFVFVPSTGGINENFPTNQALYDVIGRYYTFGMRFNL